MKHKTSFHNIINKCFKFQVSGFTMIELLIVIGITATLSVVGIGFYVNQQKAKILENTAQEIVNYLRYAQQKSVSQEQGLQWGVHFENPASGNDFYGLYSGSSYATTTEIKYLPRGLEFQTPANGNFIDVSFIKLTGFLSDTSYKQIILTDDTGIMRNILVCQQGLITYNADLAICGGIDTSEPIISNVTAYNTSYSLYVDTPFDLSADIYDEHGGVTSCEYTINGGTNWYSATVSGTGPSYSCSKIGITSTDGTVLVLNIRATSRGGTGTGSSINRTVDAIAPTCSDNWTDNWIATSPANVTITSNDARSGVATTKYCVDTTNTCTPATTGTSVSVSCSSGSTCTQYVRYAAWDNVNNVSSTYSKRVRQDLQAPTNGILNASAGNQQVSLSWSGFSDSGSGLAAANTYKLVFSTSSSPSSCSVGTQIYLGTSTSYIHSGLTNGTTYYYRVCAYDALGNISTGATSLAIPDNYCDEDNDGHYSKIRAASCPSGRYRVTQGDDCDDSCNTCYPGSSYCITTADGKDQDCDGSIDEYRDTYVCNDCEDYSCLCCVNAPMCGGTGPLCGYPCEVGSQCQQIMECQEPPPPCFGTGFCVGTSLYNYYSWADPITCRD